MGTLVVGTIIDRARRTLLELNVGEDSATDVRWDRTRELLPIFNASQRGICRHKPNAMTVNASFQLATGSKQTAPADCNQFGGVEHNLGAAGSTPGRAVNLIDRVTLSRIDPDWMTATGAAVESFVYDQRDENTFYVYPRPSGTWYVNIQYYGIPADTTTGNIDSDTISVDDIYDDVLHDLVVGYALMKNFKRGEPNKSVFYFNRAANELGIKFNMDQTFAPLDQPAATQVPNAPGKA